MSIQRCTIWSRTKPDADSLAEGFMEVGKLLDLHGVVIAKDGPREMSSGVWQESMDAFPAHEFTGQIKWKLASEGKAPLRGTLNWPIHNPLGLPGTIEFDFAWTEKKSAKFSFSDVSLLVRVLHALAGSTLATSLLVEGRRLPPQVANTRYDRSCKLQRQVALTNVDWVFGLAASDPQAKLLSGCVDSLAVIESRWEFVVCALSDSPFKYNDAFDLARLERVEAALYPAWQSSRGD